MDRCLGLYHDLVEDHCPSLYHDLVEDRRLGLCRGVHVLCASALISSGDIMLLWRFRFLFLDNKFLSSSAFQETTFVAKSVKMVLRRSGSLFVGSPQ